MYYACASHAKIIAIVRLQNSTHMNTPNRSSLPHMALTNNVNAYSFNSSPEKSIVPARALSLYLNPSSGLTAGGTSTCAAVHTVGL